MKKQIIAILMLVHFFLLVVAPFVTMILAGCSVTMDMTGRSEIAALISVMVFVVNFGLELWGWEKLEQIIQ